MIEKIWGLSDKQIVKKSNYYAYIFGAIFGFISILIGIGALLFKYSDTYKKIISYENSNIEYIKLCSLNIDNQVLNNISQDYSTILDTQMATYQSFAGLIMLMGTIFISNFILYRKLRNMLINEDLKCDSADEIMNKTSNDRK